MNKTRGTNNCIHVYVTYVYIIWFCVVYVATKPLAQTRNV